MKTKRFLIVLIALIFIVLINVVNTFGTDYFYVQLVDMGRPFKLTVGQYYHNYEVKDIGELPERSLPDNSLYVLGTASKPIVVLKSFTLNGTIDKGRYDRDNTRYAYDCVSPLFLDGGSNTYASIKVIGKCTIYAGATLSTYGHDLAGIVCSYQSHGTDIYGEGEGAILNVNASSDVITYGILSQYINIRDLKLNINVSGTEGGGARGLEAKQSDVSLINCNATINCTNSGEEGLNYGIKTPGYLNTCYSTVKINSETVSIYSCGVKAQGFSNVFGDVTVTALSDTGDARAMVLDGGPSVFELFRGGTLDLNAKTNAADKNIPYTGGEFVWGWPARLMTGVGESLSDRGTHNPDEFSGDVCNRVYVYSLGAPEFMTDSQAGSSITRVEYNGRSLDEYVLNELTTAAGGTTESDWKLTWQIDIGEDMGRRPTNTTDDGAAAEGKGPVNASPVYVSETGDETFELIYYMSLSYKGSGYTRIDPDFESEALYMFRIARKALSLDDMNIWLNNLDKEYDGTADFLGDITVRIAPEVDPSTPELEPSVVQYSTKNAGENIKIYLKGFNHRNYTVKGGAVAIATGKIIPCELFCTDLEYAGPIIHPVKVYDGNDSVDCSGAYAVVKDGLFKDTHITGSLIYRSSWVGENKALSFVPDDYYGGNYTISSTEILDVDTAVISGDITKRTLTSNDFEYLGSATSLNKPYDGSNRVLGAVTDVAIKDDVINGSVHVTVLSAYYESESYDGSAGDGKDVIFRISPADYDIYEIPEGMTFTLEDFASISKRTVIADELVLYKNSGMEWVPCSSPEFVMEYTGDVVYTGTDYKMVIGSIDGNPDAPGQFYMLNKDVGTGNDVKFVPDETSNSNYVVHTYESRFYNGTGTITPIVVGIEDIAYQGSTVKAFKSGDLTADIRQVYFTHGPLVRKSIGFTAVYDSDSVGTDKVITITIDEVGAEEGLNYIVPSGLQIVINDAIITDFSVTLNTNTTLNISGGGYWLCKETGEITSEGASAENYNVAYDYPTKTLRLNGAYLVNTGVMASETISVKANGDPSDIFTIILEGDKDNIIVGKTLTKTLVKSYAIYCSKCSMIIEGTGTLYAHGGDVSSTTASGTIYNGSFGIYCGDIDIKAGSIVYADAGTTSFNTGDGNSCGIYCKNITIDAGAEVHVRGERMCFLMDSAKPLISMPSYVKVYKNGAEWTDDSDLTGEGVTSFDVCPDLISVSMNNGRVVANIRDINTGKAAVIIVEYETNGKMVNQTFSQVDFASSGNNSIESSFIPKAGNTCRIFLIHTGMQPWQCKELTIFNFT